MHSGGDAICICLLHLRLIPFCYTQIHFVFILLLVHSFTFTFISAEIENMSFVEGTSEVMERVNMWSMLLKEVKIKVDSEKFYSKIDDGKKVQPEIDGEISQENGVESETIEVVEEKTKKTEPLEKVDDDFQITNRRKQIDKTQKAKQHRLLGVFGGPTILRPRHRTAKKGKVLLDFVQRKGWVKKVKRFQRHGQRGEQRANIKQELARAKVLAWLEGIEVVDWKSQMLHVLGRAV